MTFNNLIFPLFTACCAVSDLKNRSIDLTVCVLFFLAGLIPIISGQFIPHAEAFIPGLFLFSLSFLTHDRIGKGDALFFMLAAEFTGIREIIMLLALSLFTCSIFSLILIVIKQLERKSCRRKELPFMAFVLASYIILRICGTEF